jgi:hypothetical protein
MGTNCEMLFIFYREIPPMVDIPQSLQLPNTTTKLKVHLTYPCEFTEGSHTKFLYCTQVYSGYPLEIKLTATIYLK